MPHDTRRPDRVAEAIREAVATFLAEGVKDPRIMGLVTVTGAQVSRDLRHAKVFVSVLGSATERAATFDGLTSLAGYLRSHIGRDLRLRVAPEITFELDESIAYAARIDSLLGTVKSDARPDGDAEPVDDAPDPSGEVGRRRTRGQANGPSGPSGHDA
jgi:ribosome-binding factor A